MFLRRLDWILIGAILFLGLCSSVTLLSIAKPLFYQQLVWYGIGILCVTILVRFDWRPIVNYHWAILIFGIVVGIFIWTLIEYVMHRFAFHWETENPLGKIVSIS